MAPHARNERFADIDRPLTIKEISEKAEAVPFDTHTPFRRWLYTAEQMLKMANIYLNEANEQQAYMLFLRWCNLVLEHLSSHPHRLYPQYVNQFNRLQNRVPVVLDIMQTIKPQIEARFDAYQQELSEREARRISSEGLSETSRPSPDPPFSPSSQRSQNISLDHNLAMEIAIQEYSKLEREKRESRQPTVLDSGRRVLLDSAGREIRRVSTPSSGSYAHDLRQLSQTPPLPPGYISEFRKDAEEEAVRSLSWADEGSVPLDDQPRYEYVAPLDEQPRYEYVAPLDDQPRYEYVTPSDVQARYGYVAPSDDQPRYEYTVPPRKQRRNHNEGFDMSPFRNLPDFAREPEKQVREDVVGRWKGTYPTIPKSQYPSVPPLKVFYPDPTMRESPTPPPKIPEYLRPPTPPRAALPAIPPKEKEPVLKDFSTPAQLEDGTPLRTMFLPGALRQNFLQIARHNTRNNLETCGILCGTLIRNALFVTRLVIPEQESTSDTCQTKDEEGLFEYCSTEDLMVLGWIHTHPTQTCFMSSVDLHTHAGYQLMLPESIAIVCAPSQTPAWGIFRLTDPPGKQTIVACRNPGLFHTHNSNDIYTDALRPGHVCEMTPMGFDVVDLRSSAR